MTDSEKAQIIITVDKSELERARNRMIAEGYRYRSLDNKVSDSDSEDGKMGMREGGGGVQIEGSGQQAIRQ